MISCVCIGGLGVMYVKTMGDDGCDRGFRVYVCT